MPSLEVYKRMMSMGGNTIGESIKSASDNSMEITWWNDPQSKVCYIYDYIHDDQPDKNSGMTYEKTSKTRIDCKFIISSYGSIDKDQVAYHIMFRPSQKVEFTKDDELFYFETDYHKKYNIHFPISLYIDIPNDKGVYEKWMICDYEQGNQFIKYVVLPCDYRFEWISTEGTDRVKHRMWCCPRSMNSYTSGRWQDYRFMSLDDINKVFLPLNPITELLGYKDSNETNQRVIMGAKRSHPNTWQISKVEDNKPIGLLKFTLDQDYFNPHTDYIEYDEDGNIVGMWADYYYSNIQPIDDTKPETYSVVCKLNASTENIKVGGSYKLITAIFLDTDGNDITNKFTLSKDCWTCSIDGEDMTESDLVTWLEQADNNKIKIKISDDTSYLSKVMNIKCSINGIEGNLELELII